MNAKQKAIEFFMKEEAGLCDDEDKPQYPLQLDETLDIAIKEAKIEMCNEIIGKIDHKHEDEWNADDYIELIEQQIRHLSNSSSDKSETHNSG